VTAVYVPGNYSSSTFCQIPINVTRRHLILSSGLIEGEWLVADKSKLGGSDGIAELNRYLQASEFVVGDLIKREIVTADTVVVRNMSLVVMNRNAVIIEFDSDTHSVSVDDIINELTDLTGVDRDDIVVNIVTNDKDEIIRVEVYVDTDKTADDVAHVINDLDKSSNCTAGVMCKSKDAYVSIGAKWLATASRVEVMIDMTIILCIWMMVSFLF